MLVGLTLFMFLFQNITDGISWLSYGRLRPLHLMRLFCLCREQCLRVFIIPCNAC
jgi:cbb3-type cytochrome oxidase subunit 1